MLQQVMTEPGKIIFREIPEQSVYAFMPTIRLSAVALSFTLIIFL